MANKDGNPLLPGDFMLGFLRGAAFGLATRAAKKIAEFAVDLTKRAFHKIQDVDEPAAGAQRVIEPPPHPSVARGNHPGASPVSNPQHRQRIEPSFSPSHPQEQFASAALARHIANTPDVHQQQQQHVAGPRMR